MRMLMHAVMQCGNLLHGALPWQCWVGMGTPIATIQDCVASCHDGRACSTSKDAAVLPAYLDNVPPYFTWHAGDGVRPRH